MESSTKRTMESSPTLAVISLSGIIAGSIYLGANITGNVIADLSSKTTSIFGLILFSIGLVAGLLWIKKRR